MAALLVGLSVMAILMGAALPVWSKQAQREREEEYLFRAREYARGVMKWQHKYGASFPPTLDVLVEQRFVRRKYKDPLTGQDFNPVYSTAGPGQQPGVGSAGGTTTPGQIATGGTSTLGGGGTATLGQTGGTSSTGQQPATPGAPVIGVVSKSKASSIKVYNGRTRYDQWAVTYQDIKPGKGLPPDLLQAMNTAAAGQAGAAGGGFGQPVGGQPGAKPGANPFGTPGSSPFGQPGANPFGQPGANPFGQPGTNPFGGAGGTPFGAPGAAGQPPAGGQNPFQSAYPPPPGGQSIFGAPPPKKQ